MTYPVYPGPETVGHLWMTCDSTSVQYPDGGEGGATTTAANSDVIDATLCRIERVYLLTHSASSTLILTNHAGTTIDTIALPDSTQVMMPIELGWERRGPFGFKLGGGSGAWIITYVVIERS